MSDLWPLLGAMLVAGLAGSLHCVGMCGPILVAFQTAFRSADGVEIGGDAPPPSFRLEFGAYHLGRIWTYGFLGLVAGLIGGGVQDLFAGLGWQRPLALIFAAVWIVAGVALLVPRRVTGAQSQSGLAGPWRWSWFRTLVQQRGFVARLLLGALMGLLPCGLVYAALALGATLPTPAHAMLAMLSFGLGTLPALTAVLAIGHAVPSLLRRQGPRVVAASLIVGGCVMAWRAVMVSMHSH